MPFTLPPSSTSLIRRALSIAAFAAGLLSWTPAQGAIVAWHIGPTLSVTLVAPAPHAVVWIAPPPPRVIIAPAPRPGWIWTGGYWRWTGTAYVWVDGFWLAERPGFAYAPAHWARGPHGWIFVEGGWFRRPL